MGMMKDMHLSYSAQTLSLSKEWHYCYIEQTGLGKGLSCVKLQKTRNADNGDLINDRLFS